jgi:hypothetical protein
MFSITNNNTCKITKVIKTSAPTGVGIYWNEIKESHKDLYHFYDFTDQYDSVSGSYLGLGVAIRKKWITI